jgi:3-hydroxyisobutyrate dehydrogenase
MSASALPAIGLVGIGNMGLAMALRLLERGCTVAVRDLEPAREGEARDAGARIAASAADVARGATATVLAVVDDSQVEAVLFGPAGVAEAAAPGHAIVLCPTLSPGATEACAARLADRGIDCIDAPMSGGPARARDGSMSLMVACADAVFERHRPLLEALSSRLFRVGQRPGDGARTKLVNNLLAAVNLAGAAEALALAERVGLDPVRTLEVIEQSSGQSWIGSDRMRRALAGDLAPRAHTTLLAKDSRLALAMSLAAGFDPRLGSEAAALFARACREGAATLDDASLLDVLRR